MVNASDNLPTSGYTLGKVYAINQAYDLVPPAEAKDLGPSREINFGWSWRIVGERQFEVLLSLSVGPSKDAPERAAVRIVGAFSARGSDLTVPFERFVKLHATAILLPFAREHISALTSRGAFGPMYLPAMNAAKLSESFDIMATDGGQQLRGDSKAAARFGLLLPSRTRPSHKGDSASATPPADGPAKGSSRRGRVGG